MSSIQHLPVDPTVAAQAKAAVAFQRFSTEAWTLLAAGLLVTVLRVYARVKTIGWKGLKLDDYLACFGAVLYTVETTLAYNVGHVAKGLANNSMTDAQRAGLDPSSDEYHYRVLGSKIQIGGWTTYSTLLWALKGSLLAFFMRLTSGLDRYYQMRVYFGVGLLLTGWITVVSTIFLSCRPFKRYWQIYPNPGNVCQAAISHQIIWTCLAFNVTTDLYLISIPLPMLWHSSLKTPKKLGLMFLFSGGIFVVVCAILRCILIVVDPVNGALLAGSWAVRETFIAVVVTNLPMIVSVVKGALTSVIGTVMSGMRSSSKDEYLRRKVLTIGGGGGSGHSWRKGSGPPTANPITDLTYTESQEHIVGEYKLQEIHQSGGGLPENPANIRKHIKVTVVSEDRAGSTSDDPRMLYDAERPRPYDHFSRRTSVPGHQPS